MPPRPVLSICKEQFGDKFTSNVRQEVIRKIEDIMR